MPDKAMTSSQGIAPLGFVLTVPTLVLVLPLVAFVCVGWYVAMVRLWDRHVTPRVLRWFERRWSR